MARIDLLSLKLKEYDQLSKGIVDVSILFQKGDALVKELNHLITSIREVIDTNGETSWTKEDFNFIVQQRDDVLNAIKESLSYYVEFQKYEL